MNLFQAIIIVSFGSKNSITANIQQESIELIQVSGNAFLQVQMNCGTRRIWKSFFRILFSSEFIEINILNS